jgi:hypothetical protein
MLSRYSRHKEQEAIPEGQCACHDAGLQAAMVDGSRWDEVSIQRQRFMADEVTTGSVT